jgi:hypothetical protein
VAKKGAIGPLFEGDMPGEVPPEPVFLECVAEVRDSPKFFKILKN